MQTWIETFHMCMWQSQQSMPRALVSSFSAGHTQRQVAFACRDRSNLQLSRAAVCLCQLSRLLAVLQPEDAPACYDLAADIKCRADTGVIIRGSSQLSFCWTPPREVAVLRETWLRTACAARDRWPSAAGPLPAARRADVDNTLLSVD